MRTPKSPKLKRWVIINGEVTPSSVFSSECHVHAATKAEATRLLLTQLEAIKKMGGPELYWRNGAYLLVSHTGAEGYSMETGVFRADRIMRDGAVLALCHSGSPVNDAKAREASGWGYYSSEEYQSNSTQLSHPTVSEALSAQKLSDAAAESRT